MGIPYVDPEIPLEEAQVDALRSLMEAYQFKLRCKAELDEAYETGAMRDADQWLREATETFMNAMGVTL